MIYRAAPLSRPCATQCLRLLSRYGYVFVADERGAGDRAGGGTDPRQAAQRSPRYDGEVPA